MLTKILNIEGVGLLRQVAGGNKQSFGKTTLLYAENGRGKSTLASVLTSCANRESDLIEDRVTIDAQAQPAAKLMFGSARAEYKDGSWTGFTPDILVYDGHFVNSNVHAGNEVTSSQRAKLLDFALGSSAVRTRQREQDATATEKQESAIVKSLRQEIETLVSGKMPVPQFRALVKDPQIDDKITEAKQNLAALERSVEIKRQPLPEEYKVPSLNLREVFEVLNSTLESVHAKAAAEVNDHLSHLNDANSAPWIRHGLEIANDDECPFCGQDTSQVELLKMYRIFFDRAYGELQEKVENTSRLAFQQTNLGQIEKFAGDRSRNNETLDRWREYVSVPPLDDERDELARLSLSNLQDSLESLFARKASSITEACGNEGDLEELERLWEQFVGVYNDENEVIQGARSAINEYKNSLDASSLDARRNEVDRFHLTKLRHAPEAVDLIEKAKEAETRLKNAEKEKKDARNDLNRIMRDTLSKFKDSINEHLDSFNAEFQIAEISHNYRGSAPRVEYQIRLRGESVEINGGRPTFATALSEGDKKTMGFAFFAASTLADPNLSDKIVVIDDPMSSLDAPRREHTAKVVEQISSQANQVILMAHDGHFLRNTRDRLLQNDPSLHISEVSLRMSTGKYSDISSLDLDALCQSDYLKNYKLVSGVVSGDINEPERVKSGAIALRPLLEGYLHRKYPEVIPTGVTLGKAISAIEEAAGTDSPCAAMASRGEDLREMNDYASQFHHETQPDYDAAQRADHREIARNGEKILEFIHSA
ncbi:AAA family ATPase [Corynebacterium glyciniphilum]|uniref:AAA family ATPase n=1 Tax=Corynebacterium glyciniphilum TaxID=1404244 RepID=UPI003FD4AE34